MQQKGTTSGQTIENFRTRKGWTLREFAAKLGVTGATMQRWEARGANPIPFTAEIRLKAWIKAQEQGRDLQPLPAPKYHWKTRQGRPRAKELERLLDFEGDPRGTNSTLT